ncbi:MAG: hypothetical protein A2312_01890 [Candidatus Staskawiczbacteria bacterium RIFOXYB2_FULL_32_9]|uniref:Uncharacterized protein n=1 Tax=Candidatus Staskawiczbacteria bacterium RIFOXYD1_FULL_32_13 TaxID=1802234 RepID=A0A1G2JKR5_9BACT|nr:MAG: Epidermal growth factor receptor [Parcubacteria group bacterium GW2011_GWC2_32_10]OGZ77328.1 MAG: hypothetical protein A2256_03720 [Candidatus Staskawiczbacteria bacterium RIFOXYA2_FULL_32_7]OGZ82121.1 MAG: hypothetical protein A2312_01890 [Candidatus Staskawiczbacteria bacterium RIFOXYB2_FULL_32_9]OGZ87285.1 MAG: hypothetical protein A2463_02900 [Candidatus Staskawiczbacteria bacterium RIFOXYC2_FULL_32_10]OGZ87737.1 MAG: hypothetical protein A2561_03535 [Candidatus Staskawiczbacteria b
MNSEIKNCQNCKQEFTIESEDFDFYEKVKVPAPTFCPECRMQRRMIFMNERALYKRQCDLCHKDVISVFPANATHPVYCTPCWWSDNWNPLIYGKDYDFSKSFFQQFKELMSVFPWPALDTIEPSMVNSPYCSISSYLKNCYFFHNSDYSENSAYGAFTERAKDSYDLFTIDGCEQCYEGVNLVNCNCALFSMNCENCHNVSFSRDLTGCSYCFGCINLRNKNYYIFNEPYSKEEYFSKLKTFDAGSYKAVQGVKENAKSLFLKSPRRFAHSRRNSKTTGEYVNQSKNTQFAYQVIGAEDSKYVHFLIIAPTKDSYDLTMWGGNANRLYECMGCGGGQDDVKFSYGCWSDATMNLEYCMVVKVPCTNLFGCIGLRRKSYCILNKQYTKEEYNLLCDKIIKHMNDAPFIDKLGKVYKYGEFFPAELGQFAYNESVAQQFFPLDKQEAIKQGYNWKDSEERNYKIDLKSQNLPDHIKDVSDDIAGKVIECAHKGECNEQCTTAYKIIPQELQFYKKMDLPLPRLCPNCRHYQRLAQRNPIKLWHRQCMNVGCKNEFETSYAPDRPEIIYCETCYNNEVA